MTTNQLSHEQSASSRNMQSRILTAVAENKQVNVAKSIGVDSSTVGRWLDAKNPDSQVGRFCDLLAACGLKIVPADMQHYDEAKVKMLVQVAKYYFHDLKSLNDLFKDDEIDVSPEIRFSRMSVVADSDVNADSGFDLLAMVITAAAKAPKDIELARIVPASDSKPVQAYGHEDALKDEIEAKIHTAIVLGMVFLAALGVMSIAPILIFGQ